MLLYCKPLLLVFNIVRPSIISVALFTWSPFSIVFGQNHHKIDSLRALVSKSEAPGRIDLLREIAFEYIDNDDSIALNYINEAIPLANSIGDTVSIVKFSRYRGQVLGKMDKLKDAVNALEAVLPIAKRNKLTLEVIQIYRALSLINTYLADYVNAYVYGIKCLDLMKIEKDRNQEGLMLVNIGVIYYKMENYSKAKDYFVRAVTLFDKMADECFVKKIKANIGLCYIFLGDIKLAEHKLHNAFDISGKACDESVNIHKEFNFGVLNFFKKDLDEAKDHFRKSCQSARIKDDKRLLSDNLLYLGRIAYLKKEYKVAEKFFRGSLDIALACGYYLLVMDNYYELSKLYKEINELRNASLFLEKYVQIRDSTLSLSVMNKIATIQNNYEQGLNQEIISKGQRTVRKHRVQTILMCIATVILGAFAVGLIKQVRRSRQINQKLHLMIEARTTNFEVSTSELRRAIEDQTLFFDRLVERIKSPLATIRGIYKTAEHESESNIVKEYFQLTQNAANGLSDLVDKLVLINRLNNHNFSGERHDLSILVKESIELVKQKSPFLILYFEEPEIRTIVYTNRRAAILLLQCLIESLSCISETKKIHLAQKAIGIQAVVSLEMREHGLTNKEIDLTLSKRIAQLTNAKIVNDKSISGAYYKVIFSVTQKPTVFDGGNVLLAMP